MAAATKKKKAAPEEKSGKALKARAVPRLSGSGRTMPGSSLPPVACKTRGTSSVPAGRRHDADIAFQDAVANSNKFYKVQIVEKNTTGGFAFVQRKVDDFRDAAGAVKALEKKCSNEARQVIAVSSFIHTRSFVLRHTRRP